MENFSKSGFFPGVRDEAMKLDLVSLASFAGLRVARYKLVGIQVT